jgi:hypothetical protein
VPFLDQEKEITMTQPANIPATVPASKEPVSPRQRVASEAFDLSKAIGQFGREILETGDCDASSLKALVRRMGALNNAALIAEEAKTGSSDADLVLDILRNPHRMKGVQIL